MADRIEVYDGTVLVEQAEGPDGPTHFVRLGTERITPRAAGDLIVDPNVAAIDWDTGWLYPTFVNGWVNYGSPFTVARYRRSAGRVVHLDGLIKSGTINTAAFTLPSGFRPSYRLITCAVDTGNAAPERLDIHATGVVHPVSGSNGWVTLQTVFVADGA